MIDGAGLAAEEPAAIAVAADTTHPWGPVVVNRPAAEERRLLKVVAFNARTGRALDRIAERLRRPPLANPEIILLSEMDWRMPRSDGRETTAELAANLGMSFAYIGEFALRPRDGVPVSFVGNAILSHWPLADVRVLPLARASIRRRMQLRLGAPAGLVAKVTLNRRQLAVGVAHLNSRWSPSGRELQIRQYLEGFPRAVPAIIGGDFNTTTIELGSPASFLKVGALSIFRPNRFHRPQRWEPLFERLREAGFHTTGANVNGTATFTPSRLVPPIVRPKLDWLALRGLRPVAGSAAVVPARMSLFTPRFSDHDFIMCVVQV
jgi:endonuclease/exonuclease/phosphatase family metal-dependent hydrolase